MKKPLLYKLFGWGKIPKTINRSELLVKDEGIKIGVVYKDYLGQDKRVKSKKKIFIGSIMCTKNQLVAYAYKNLIINLSLTDKRLSEIDFSESTTTVLVMKFDISIFDPKSKGKVVYSFYTNKSDAFVEKVCGK